MMKRLSLMLINSLMSVFFMGLSAQTNPLQLNMSSGTGCTGENICLHVTAKDFEKVESIQFNLSYNANLVIPQCPATYVHPNIANNIFGDIFNCNQKASGFINFVWAGDATSIPDGDTLFTLCFTIIGPAGNSTPVYFNGLQLPVEICKQDASGALICNDELISNVGNITLSCSDLEVFFGKCDADSGNIAQGGSVTFYCAGGKAPYNWSMSPGTYSGTLQTEGQRKTLQNIPPGNYTITITDANGNVRQSKNINVSDNLPLKLDVVEIKNPTCYNRTNGSISIKSVSGGIPNYKYQWSTFISGKESIENISSGKYFVTVTDLEGCQKTDSFTLKTDTIKFSAVLDKNPACLGVKNGFISLNITGGTPFKNKRYEFSVEGPDYAPTWRELNKLASSTFRAGSYIISVRDSFGCLGLTQSLVVKDTIVLVPAKKVSVVTLDRKDISCAGLKDGMIKVTAAPSGVYSFVPTPNIPNSFVSTGSFTALDLGEGSYKITIRDGEGCTGDTILQIKEPDTLKINPVVVQADCAKAGSLTLAPTGGTGQYTYTWNPDQGNTSGPSVFNISGGTYSVTVTDENNCSASFSQVFGTQGALTIFPKIDSVTCAGANDGKLCIDILSGNGPFVISWRDAGGNQIGITQCINKLVPGTYSVIVTDASGCSNSASGIVVAEPVAISTKQVISPAPCFGEKGSISISIDGGGAGFQYEWRRKGETTVLDRDNQLNEIAGEYIVTAISPKGCRKDFAATITQPAEILLAAPNQTRKVSCFGKSDGSATYVPPLTGVELFWSSNPGSPAPFAINLKEGIHWVYARNLQSKCKSDTVFFTIESFPTLGVDAGREVLVSPICFGEKNGKISIEAKGGTGTGYVYTWSNGLLGNTLSNLSAGDYVVTISDQNNCTFIDTVKLSQPPRLETTVDKSGTVELDCKNQSNGKIALTTSGGNPGIKTFQWQNGVATENGVAVGLSPGIYCSTITDNAGCKDTFCYTMTAPAPLKGEINDPAEPLCFGDKTCVSVKSLTGGTGRKYTFQINNGKRFPIDTCVTVTAGQYFISLIDSAGCSIDTSITISQPDPVAVSLGPDQDIQLGLPSPVIRAVIGTSASVVSASWNPSIDINCLNIACTEVEASPSETTKYTLLVTDANGCTGTDDITIRVKNARNVFFPNAFSPNRDGNNDFFQAVTGPGVEKILFLTVFDRWGNLVFERKDFMPDPTGTDGWDGTFNGRRLDPGVFVFISKAKFIDGKEIDYSGTVVLADKTRN
ncbi:MAG: gliding motility-associated C-terminal domain-containing protein [Saprospiraceae bacterium]|jgi:gliding motility-associated-like protein|nr:gliding motility-associated C-terminal domain-containing protein [Saprospiraceae bacterium]